VAKQRFHDFVIAEADRLRGDILMCSHHATSDSIIEVSEATSVEDIPRQSLQAKICQQKHIDNILQITLKFTRGNALRFLPGQFVRLQLPCNSAITLPISSCPCESSSIELHLHTKKDAYVYSNSANTDEVKEYAFADRLLKGSSRNKVLVDGPIGGVSLSKAPAKPQLFLAEGIEFRGLQGLIEQLFNLETDAPIALIWLSTQHTNHYRANLCRSWADAMDNFSYIPLDNITKLPNCFDSAFLDTYHNASLYHTHAESSLLSGINDSKLTIEHTTDLSLPEQ
jgi:CDP-4-dehydro-6-deoxyglucose reductase